MRLGGPQTPGRYGEEKYVWLLPRIELRFLSHTVCSLVTLPTELYLVAFRHKDITNYHPEPQYRRDRKPEYVSAIGQKEHIHDRI